MFWWNETALLKKQLQTLQNELEKEQGKAARLSGFLSRLQGSGSGSNDAAERPLAEAVVDALHALMQAEQALFLGFDPVSYEFMPLSARGFSPQTLSNMHVKSAEALAPLLAAGHLMQTLQSKSKPLGILVAAKPSAAFTVEEKSIFALLAAQVSILLTNQTLTRTAKETRTEMVDALTRALGAKDSTTHLHTKRTRMLTRAMGKELNLPEVLIQVFEEGALLHDIGKIGIDDAILKKPSELTHEEREVMKNHAVMGKAILDPMTALQGASSIVLYHQEWYNGAGYPEGLAGEEIPLGARVVQILDAWDAMTSNRPYRKALTKTAAIAELRRQAGKQFDPKLVDLFLRLVDKLEREGIATTEQPAAAAQLASRKA